MDNPCMLYCIVSFLLNGRALSCAVSSRSTFHQFPGGFESEALPTVGVRVSVGAHK